MSACGTVRNSAEQCGQYTEIRTVVLERERQMVAHMVAGPISGWVRFFNAFGQDRSLMDATP